MTKTLLFSILLFASSCSVIKPIASERNQKWSNFFKEKEQKRLLFLDALKDFKRGKKKTSIEDLNSAEKKFQFLSTEYADKGAEKKLSEISKFRQDYKAYYQDLATKAMKKKLIFTAAGYYKRIQSLFPLDPNSVDFFTSYESEIPKRLKRNLQAGKNYIKAKKLSSAKRCYQRILNYDAKNSEARKGLIRVNRLKKEKRLLARKAALEKKKRLQNRKKSKTSKKTKKIMLEEIKEIQVQSKAEQARLYRNGIKAYEGKDYLKAYELFEAIEDTTYKDTELYFNRSQDKIDALGLSDEN